MSKTLKWHKVPDNPAALLEGRFMTATTNHKTFCLTRHKGQFGCLDHSYLSNHMATSVWGGKSRRFGCQLLQRF